MPTGHYQRCYSSAASRFEKHYIPEPNSGCWLWIGAMAKGYGSMKVEGKRQRAHRISHEIHRGPIPDGMAVCHKCDMPACVNPDHLFLGTQIDNISDCIEKRRHHLQSEEGLAGIRGERNYRALFTDAQVREIRASPLTGYRLAKHYGVTNSCIYRIKRGESWRHIPMAQDAKAAGRRPGAAGADEQEAGRTVQRPLSATND